MHKLRVPTGRALWLLLTLAWTACSAEHEDDGVPGGGPAGDGGSEDGGSEDGGDGGDGGDDGDDGDDGGDGGDGGDASADEDALRALIASEPAAGAAETGLLELAASGGLPVATESGTYLFACVCGSGNWSLSGDHNDWAEDAMATAGALHWIEATVSSPDGSLYKFTDGDAWIADPLGRRYGYDTYGEFSLVRASAAHLERWYAIEGYGLVGRDLQVWVPDDGVFTHALYAHDGQNLFDPQAIWGGWRLQDSLPGEMLVVGIDNTADRMEEYTHTTDVLYGDTYGGWGDDYADLVELVIRPMMEEAYGDADVVGTLGSSLGGLISFHIADRHEDAYDFAASMSGTMGWGSFGVQNPTMIRHLRRRRAPEHRPLPGQRRLRNLLRQRRRRHRRRRRRLVRQLLHQQSVARRAQRGRLHLRGRPLALARTRCHARRSRVVRAGVAPAGHLRRPLSHLYSPAVPRSPRCAPCLPSSCCPCSASPPATTSPQTTAAADESVSPLRDARAAPAPGGLNDDHVVATWDGGKLTYGELRDELGAQLITMEVDYLNEKYRTELAGTEQVVVTRLLEAEAKAKGHADIDKLIEAEVLPGVTPPTDAEVEAYYEQVRRKLRGMTLEQAKPQLMMDLLQRKQMDAVQTYASQLRDNANVTTNIPFPDLPRIEVSVDDDPSVGAADAPVTIVQFAEFQCPYCGKSKETVDKVLADYEGKVRMVFRDYPLSFHDRAIPAAVAANCAGEQDKYWEMYDVLMSNQRALSDEDLTGYATRIELDLDKWNTCPPGPRPGRRGQR